MTPNPLRPLSIGEILDGVFTLYRRHFVSLFLTALIPFAPLALMYARMMSSGVMFDPAAVDSAYGSMFLVVVGGTLGAVLALAMLTSQFSQAYTGGGLSLGGAFTHGIRALLPLFGAVFLAYVILFVTLFVFAMAGGLIAGILSLGGGAGAFLGGLVTVVAALAIGMFFLTALFAVVPAVVIERRGPWGAIRRSWQLSSGARPRILAVLFIGWLITMLPTMGIMVAAGMSAALIDPTAAASLTTGQIYFQQGAGLISGALTFPFLAGSLVLLYYDRRIRTEGYDLEVATEALAVTP